MGNTAVEKMEKKTWREERRCDRETKTNWQSQRYLREWNKACFCVFNLDNHLTLLSPFQILLAHSWKREIILVQFKDIISTLMQIRVG